jgi:hypothetical protein
MKLQIWDMSKSLESQTKVLVAPSFANEKSERASCRSDLQRLKQWTDTIGDDVHGLVTSYTDPRE